MRAQLAALCLAAAAAQVPSLEELGSVWQARNETVGNMPTVTNFYGSSTISTDPDDALGVDTYDAFPYVGWLRTRLSATDASGSAQLFAPNASRWFAHRTERLAFAPGPEFAAVTASVTHRFLFESATTLVQLTLRNGGAAPVRLRSLTLSATSGVRAVTGMAWVVPLPGDDGSWVCAFAPPAGAARTPPLFFLDSISRARQVVATVPPPANATAAGNWGAGPRCAGVFSYGDVLLAPNGGEWSLALGMQPGDDVRNATAALLGGALADAGAAAAASDAAWQARWAQAFAPGNGHFSGNAPVLTAPPGAAAARFYYMSVLSVLTAQRVNWPTSALFADCPRMYAIGQEGLAGGGAPAGRPLGGSAFWVWDEGYASLLLSVLDPDAVRAYLRAILRGVNISTTNAFDLISGEAIAPWPDGFGGGGPYAFNTLQLFTMASQYVTATNDTAFLSERVGGGAARARVADALLEMALHWRGFDADGDFLAEYSADAGAYLECVPHYRGAVAALQAGSVSMMRSVADMVDALFAGDAALGPWPPTLRALAANMSAATRARLYVRGAGVWAAHVSGGAPEDTPVPTVVDFAHVARLLRPDLDAAQRAEPASFFLADLLFPPWTGWLRALAVPDGDGSRRADHGTTGAYTAWASLAAEALAFSDGNWSRAAALFDRFAPALRLGPLGQAGQVQAVGAANDTLHAVFKAPQWPFVNVAGANFADVILRSLFGMAPKWAARSVADVPLAPALGQGGFVGRLDHLRTPAGLASVDSDGARLVWQLEGAGRGRTL